MQQRGAREGASPLKTSSRPAACTAASRMVVWLELAASSAMEPAWAAAKGGREGHDG
jgi:hypothetical protein